MAIIKVVEDIRKQQDNTNEKFLTLIGKPLTQITTIFHAQIFLDF